MMNSLKIKFFVTGIIFLMFCGCLGQKDPAPIENKSKTYKVYDISYKIPVAGVWYEDERSEYHVILRSGQKKELPTCIAKIEVIDNEGYYTDDQLYYLMQKTFLLPEKTRYKDRYEIMESNTSRTHKGPFCIRLYSKVKDFKPDRLPNDADHIILEKLEKVCRHPKDLSKFVTIGFSRKSAPGKPASNFLQAAEYFFANIEF